MDSDLAASRWFQNTEAIRKYAPFFHNNTQLQNFLRIPIADKQRDELLYNLQREVKREQDANNLDAISNVFDAIPEEEEENEFRLPTPASSSTST